MVALDPAQTHPHTAHPDRAPAAHRIIDGPPWWTSRGPDEATSAYALEAAPVHKSSGWPSLAELRHTFAS